MMKRITKSSQLKTEIIDVQFDLKTDVLCENVVGKKLEVVKKLVADSKKILNITLEDGKYLICETGNQFRSDRLNVEIQKGVVVRAAIG